MEAISLTRVEGEGKVVITTRHDRVKVDVFLTEPNRYFEKILENTRVEQGVDVVSRICGFCGVSHNYAFVKAFESEHEIPEEIEVFRQAILHGERVKSHLLHTCFMYLPSLLGYGSFNDFLSHNPRLISMCLQAIESIREFMNVFSGRIHNIVNIRLGGVYYYPEKQVLTVLKKRLETINKAIGMITEVVSRLSELFDEKHIYGVMCLKKHGNPFHSDKFYVDTKLYDVSDYEKILTPLYKPGSNEKRYVLRRDKVYVMGPLARYEKTIYEKPDLIDWLKANNLWVEKPNLYFSIVARLAEIRESISFLINYIDNYVKPRVKHVDLKIVDGTYYAIVEAPRGILYHRYVVENGVIKNALIITPTQFNVYAMEKLTENILNTYHRDLVNDKRKLRAKSLSIIRSFDPCISCAVHVISPG